MAHDWRDTAQWPAGLASRQRTSLADVCWEGWGDRTGIKEDGGQGRLLREGVSPA